MQRRRSDLTAVVDISASQGHIVPTAASKHGFFAKLVPGFTTVLGLAVDNGKLYVLEMSNLLNGPAPESGDIVSIDLFGNQKTVVSGLDFPTGITQRTLGRHQATQDCDAVAAVGTKP